MAKTDQDLTLPREGFAKLPQILHVLKISRTQFYDNIKAGLYPAPIKRGRSSLWPVTQIREIIEKESGLC